ncbi:PTS transporter subunit EIIC [Melghirimyces algeriensis]|uniref:PTS system IIB component, Glc family /PTS system IIC component, Glc family n=1 Tax=Melghirimyces algeriensis TaxID=910412 RepID=A0A521F8A1_9BACL|nr:PTS transporter subunit EIIC [Melghirimyces algeriensis]SMO92346.1 PTS system IIB component, Glc family /PTS system IIC component, Glc family [Melghirimyces algeriensis]
MGNEKQLAEHLMKHLGGSRNIQSLTHCMTRLRIQTADADQVELKAIKNLDGVMGVVEDETLQIILGPGTVTKVCNHLSEMMDREIGKNDTDGQEDDPFAGLAQQTKQDLKQKNSTPFKMFLRRIASIFIPLIPAIVASGLIAGITNIIVRLGVDEKATIITILSTIGWGLFTYLGVFVGINTAKEFGGTPALGGAAGILIINPSIENISLFGEQLSPGTGGLIGVMLAAVFIAWMEKQVRKIVPTSLDIIVTPTISLLITGFVTYLVLQPIGGWISQWITDGLTSLLDMGGAVAGAVLAGTFLPLVVTGLHQGLTPIHMELINSTGVDALLPILAMGGCGQVGAAFAIYLKTKDQKLKKVIKGGLPVGILGIGEPLIYGVTLPLGRPFLTACLGAAVGGVVQAIFDVATIAIGVSGLPLTFLVLADQIVYYLFGLALAYLFGFLFTYWFGFREEMTKAFK